MPLYLVVSAGPRADQARPLLALSDQRLIAALLRAISELGAAVSEAEQEDVATAESILGRFTTDGRQA